MNYVEALQQRYSVKKFDSTKKIPSPVLQNILEAGKLSASSLGLQPYKVFVVESPEKLAELKPAFYNPSQISTCSHLIVIVTRKKIEEQYIDNYFGHISDTRNIPVENLAPFRKSISFFMDFYDEQNQIHWNEKQSYLMLGTLMFAAAMEQVDSCPIEGFIPDKLSEILEIDTSLDTPTITLALGYRAEDDVFRTMKKVRKPSDLLFKYFK